jgi:CheY-like chemotaxis protein
LAASECPDRALVDLQQPGIDGVEAFSRLRKRPTETDIPVVAVTAQAIKHDRERTLQAGFAGVELHILQRVATHQDPPSPAPSPPRHPGDAGRRDRVFSVV